jgi:hypothetical protein
MKIKRGVWVAACLIGIAVFGGLAVLLGAMIFWGVEDGVRTPSGFIEWAVTFILIAAACGSALFVAPKDIDAATALEVDEDPAQWVKDLRKQSETNERN